MRRPPSRWSDPHTWQKNTGTRAHAGAENDARTVRLGCLFSAGHGVSTSIRTFREDLHTLGVETDAGGAGYPGQAADTEERVVRVPSGGVPKDPEDRRFEWGALRATLARLGAQARFDLVHIHTPFIAHYAAVKFARSRGLPIVATYHTFFEEYLHHYVPLLPRAWSRGIARRSRARNATTSTR
ncbi:MAG: glycosyltransferase [Minicystis sp.]